MFSGSERKRAGGNPVNMKKRICSDIKGNMALSMMIGFLCISITVLLGIEQYMFRIYDRYESACIKQVGSYISVSWNDERSDESILHEINSIAHIKNVEKTEEKQMYVFFDSYRKMMQSYKKLKKYADEHSMKIENETKIDIENIEVVQIVNKITKTVYWCIVLTGSCSLYIICRYWKKRHTKEQLLYYSLGLGKKKIVRQNITEVLGLFFISVLAGYILQYILVKVCGNTIAQWYYALSGDAYLYTGNYEKYFTDQAYQSLTGKIHFPYWLSLCLLGSLLIFVALRREKDD